MVTKMYSQSFEGGKGPMKSMPQASNILHTRIELRGISSLFEMLLLLWHLSQVVTYCLASLNKDGQKNPTSSTLAAFFLSL